MLITAKSATRDGTLPMRLRRHSFRLLIAVGSLLPASQLISVPANAFDTGYASRAEVLAICARPFPPYPEHYDTAGAFNAAREAYYVEASVYVSHCIDRWVGETRQRYQDMFKTEAEAYLRDRQAVMDEMRDAAQLKY